MDYYIFGRSNSAFPIDFETVGLEQIPLLGKLGNEYIPEALISFDQPSRVQHFDKTGLHFFIQDRKFQGVLIHPEKFVSRFSNYKVVLTPDCTLSKEMPPSVRFQNIRVSRQAGAVWQSRGLPVVPTVRWSCEEDYDVAFSGIPLRSIVAVGSYGAMRDRSLRRTLLNGLEEMVHRLQPVSVLLYGSMGSGETKALEMKTRIVKFCPPMWNSVSPIEPEDSRFTLFPNHRSSQVTNLLS